MDSFLNTLYVGLLASPELKKMDISFRHHGAQEVKFNNWFKRTGIKTEPLYRGDDVFSRRFCSTPLSANAVWISLVYFFPNIYVVVSRKL
jgi:hypothetical protein